MPGPAASVALPSTFPSPARAVSMGWHSARLGELLQSGEGVQRGLAIGIVNFAEELHGAQIGLINIARNNPSGRRVLPVINWHRD